MNIGSRLPLLAAILLFTSTTASAATVEIPYDKFVLDNGLTVIVHEDRKAPIVAVSVWYKVGSRDEPEGQTGFAHLFEHLMFEGSENHDDDYWRPLEQVGATNRNGTTSFDRTNYFQNVPTPALDMVLWLESDRMGHLLGAVTQEKLDNEIGVVQNEKRQGDNQPYGRRVMYRMLEGLFPEGHPYRHPPIGSLADLEAASLDDVHQWFKDYYGAANTVLVLAGDIDAETARPLVEKYFGHIPAGPPVRHITAMVPERTHDTFEVMYDRVPQVRTYRNWAVPGRTDRERYMLELAASVLGSGKNSRLYQALVYQNQLAVNISVSVSQFELASVFGIDVLLKPGASLDEVNEILDTEMARFLADGPTEQELERARTSVNAGIVRGLEQIGGFSGKATSLARGELYAGDPAFFVKGLEWFNTAEAEEVTAASRKWLSKGRYQMDVLPFGEYTTLEPQVDRSTGLPEVGALPDLEFPEIQRAELKNGMQVVLAERHTIPVVNVALSFDAGYAADTFGVLGASSFAMSMLDEGTKSMDALEISAEMELLGMTYGAGSNLDMTTIRMSALNEKLEPSMELFADIVRNPVFDEGEIERLRQRWIPAIQQEKADPVGIAVRILPPLLYGKDHAYGIPLRGNGTEASIASLARDDLVSFHSTWIRPSNGTVFVVGATTMEEILPLLEDNFGNWREDRRAIPQKNLAEVQLPEQGQIVIIDKPGSPQSLILGGHVAPPTGVENNAAIQTANDILGGTSTSRANMNLREDKGWSYGARTLMFDGRGQRMWMAYAPVQTDRTGESIAELNREFAEYLSTRPAEQDELLKSVRNTTNSLPGQFETAGAVLGSLLSNQRYGRPDDYVEGIAGVYRSLNLENVQAAAEELIHSDSITWMIVGDREAIEAQLEGMDLGEIRIMDVDGNVIE